MADFSFCAFTLLLITYAAFLGPARAGVCEELSHHPELMRDMLEMGLNLENCERWLERAVFVVLAVFFVIMVVRVSPSSYCHYCGNYILFNSAAFHSCSIKLLLSSHKASSTWTNIIRIIKFITLARNATYLPPSQEYHRPQ